MRDLRGAASRHRARFVLDRPMVPPVGRVLMAARGLTVLHPEVRTTLAINTHPTYVVSRPTLVIALPAAQPGRDPAPGPVPGRRQVAAAVRTPATRVGSTTVLGRLDRVLTSMERRVTRTEERVPQVTRVVSHTTVAGGVVPAAETRPTAPSSVARALPTTDGPRPQAPLDLARITDHVLGVMDDRLAAHAERLGRG